MPGTIDALDRLFSLGAGRQRFFADGWGDRELLDSLSVEDCVAGAPADIHPSDGSVRRHAAFTERAGSFESPETRLPEEARTARFLHLCPAGERRATVLILAASGDQGFAMRRRFAAGLVERGIAAVLLENPYYGSRRPAARKGVAVRTVAEMALMASATIREARALLAWLARETERPVGISGYSMGGQMAAMAGASTSFPIACIPLAPSSTPASVFTEGLLRRVVDVDALSPGDPARAMPAIRAAFLRFDVCALPPPVFPAGAIIVGAERDGIVPPAEPLRIARHWGAELRWLPTGHVGAVLRHGGEMRAAIEAALGRLTAGRQNEMRSGAE